MEKEQREGKKDKYLDSTSITILRNEKSMK